MALITSLFLLMLHVIFNKMPDVTLSPLNIVVDTISMIISSSLYLYTDDIETRRKIISGVFENRYKKKRRIK